MERNRKDGVRVLYDESLVPLQNTKNLSMYACERKREREWNEKNFTVVVQEYKEIQINVSLFFSLSLSISYHTIFGRISESLIVI